LFPGFCTAFAAPSDTLQYKLGLANTGILNHTRLTNAYTLSNTLRFGVKGRKTELDAGANYTYGVTDNELVNNDVTANLSGNRYVFADRRFYIWGLGAYESSYSLGVASRTQTGIGIAWSPIDSPRAYVNFSEGVLVENSNIKQPDNSTSTQQTLRNSFRFRFRFASANAAVVFEGTNSIQNSFEDFNDYLLRFNNSLTIKVYKGVGLTAAAAYNKVTATNRENLLLTLGFKVDYVF
jgi:hypothetical protein